MHELGRYDTEIQMFVEAPKTASISKLGFHRWRAERGDFGYKPYSVPKGPDLFRLPPAQIARYALMQGDSEPDQKMKQDSMHKEPKSDYEQQH